MSKKDGAVFAKSLFGYKKRDVNEYIRLADESNSEKITECETRIKELEETLSYEKAFYQAEIKKLSDDKEIILKNAECAKLEYDGKLADSEARCASYLKLADAATLRAETAEQRIKELSSELELQNSQVNSLNAKVEADEKLIAQLNAEIEAFRTIEEKKEKTKVFKIRRPSFFKIIRK